MAIAETTPGAVPPQNLEAEESVLGAMMVSESAIDPVILEIALRDEDFYRDRHRTIYRAILKLHGDADPVDALTVSEALTQRGELDDVGGRDLIASLAATVPAAGNAKHYAAIVKQNALLRRLDAAAKEIQQSVAERTAEPKDLAESAESLLFKVAHEERSSDFREIGAILSDEIDKLEALSKGDEEVTGTASGYRDLDGITGGFQRGNLVVFAARPAMGKSSLVCNIAENVALKDRKAVALFSLEMSEAELAHRFIASQARLPSDQLRKGRVAGKDWPGVVTACNRLAAAPLWIDDSSDLGLLELRAKARRLHAQEMSKGGLGLVIVDYIQLMRAEDPRANRVEQVGQMSRGLKILARELDVPVIGVSQLSRAPEQRPDKRPILSDLRESGCLTGDSQVYLPESGTYRPISELAGRRGFKVLALNEATWKLEPCEASNAFSTGHKPVLRLTTQLGRTIRATANHQFRTIDGWKRVDELEPGMRVALPRLLRGPSRPTMADSELALLGHLIGDGCTLPRHAIQYTTNERWLAELVASLALDAFGDRISPRISRERRWFQVYLPSSRRLTHGVRNPIATWLDSLGAFGLRAHEKRVPSAVFAQPPSKISLFLQHLWSTDGCVWLGGRARPTAAIYYATSSAGLARDVQSLLLRLGINATLSERPQGRKGRAQHHVRVSGGPEMRRFLTKVGGLGRQKEQAQVEILKSIAAQTTNTNRDVVPRSAWRDIVVPAMETAGVTTRQLHAGIGSSYCGSALYKSNLSRERATRVAEVVQSEELRCLADGDVYWDQVVSIAPAGEEEVYDLTVPGHSNFVADDLVVHNSIEQDSDLVGFLYRDEYYNPESEDPGVAELKIAKHRNGPTDTVKLVFLKRYPKFADMSREAQPAQEQPAGEGLPLMDASAEADANAAEAEG